MAPVSLPIAKLQRRADARLLREETLPALMASIRELGIINPLRVRSINLFENGRPAQGWEIVAGAHRFEAAVRCGLDEVPCTVVEEDDLRAELAMLDENLCRAELSPAERAGQTARRKEIYEELHPETRHGGDRRSDQVAKFATRKNQFTQSTAAATGKSKRAVQLDAERGAKVCTSALALIAGTHLDTGTYLDKLKRLAPGEQADAAKRDLAAGSARPVRKPVTPSDPPRNDFEIANQEHRALVRAWEGARPEMRERFLAEINAVIDEPAFDRTSAGKAFA